MTLMIESAEQQKDLAAIGLALKTYLHECTKLMNLTTLPKGKDRSIALVEQTKNMEEAKTAYESAISSWPLDLSC